MRSEIGVVYTAIAKVLKMRLEVFWLLARILAKSENALVCPAIDKVLKMRLEILQLFARRWMLRDEDFVD